MAHCAARQINGLDNRKIERITGTKGFVDASGTIYDDNGEILWKYPYPDDNDTDQSWRVQNPSIQEQVELVTAIRTGRYINDSEEQVKSTLIAIMGRMAAYTGREITWEELLNSDMSLGPETYQWGPVQGMVKVPPAVGLPPSPTDRSERYR